MLEKIKLYSLYRKPFEVATEIHGPLYKELLYEESPVGLQSGFVGCCDGRSGRLQHAVVVGHRIVGVLGIRNQKSDPGTSNEA